MHLTSISEIYSIFKQHPYISTDSRIATAGSIFFALKGENFDGNKYALSAIEKGVAYAVIDNPEYYNGNKTLLVEDTLKALQQLASLHRENLNIPIIGITGSNGKTTTKELIAAALSARFNTHATPGNLNNHIGVPLTVLSVGPETEIAIVEMGANHVGEIAALCKIARPTHGIITNIGKAHLEGFGGPEGVIKAKSELYQHLYNFGGTVFVNSNNPLLMSLSDNLNRILFGSDENLTYSAKVSDHGPMLKVDVIKPLEMVIQTKLTGNYNFENVMAAFTIASHFKVNSELIKQAIETYEPKMNRSQVLETSKNTLILDAYNANPSSMESAIGNFKSIKKLPKVMILGDMFELGDAAPEEHTAILKMALMSDAERIITAGQHFYNAAKDFENIQAFPDVATLRNQLINEPVHGCLVLIKGSRGMKLETITDLL